MLVKCEDNVMSKYKLIIIVVVALLVLGAVLNALSTPSQAEWDDFFSEDIGGDGFMVATLNHSLKTHEQNIGEGVFSASAGEINYYDAKNISYVDSVGCENYMIVWKTTPDKYSFFDTKDKVNQYVSDYSTKNKEVGFIEYSFKNNAVYGIIIAEKYAKIRESELMYDILGLDKQEFPLVYTQSAQSYTSSYDSSSGHYHTVVPDRYTLSRTDPGAYYDHYEYGDNYDIDDYLESEGYD